MRWTLEDIRFANSITAEEWSTVHGHLTGWTDPKQHERYSHWLFWNLWDVVIWAQRLTWLYGESGALERLNGQMARSAA